MDATPPDSAAEAPPRRTSEKQAKASPDAGLSREVKLVAGVVVLGVIMSVLDTTIVNVALDTLSRDLHSPLSTIQWVSTGYLLSLAMVIPLAGWLSERFGSKPVWMVSVAVFAVGSALCGIAWSAGSLIFFRLLQGFGGGLIMPVGMSVLAQTAGPRHMGRVMSVIGVPMLLGPVLGPVLGGLIVTNAPWQWIFYVNVPIAALSLILAARLLNSRQGRTDAGPLDWLGVVLLSPGLAGVVFGLAETETSGGLSSAIAWGPIAAGIVLVALFVRHALHARRPLLDLNLFRSTGFSAAAASVFLLGAALFGAMLLLPLYYQVDRGESALSAGLLMAPQGLGAALVMPVSGRLTDRIGGGRVALFGIAVMTLATFPLVGVRPTSSYGWLALVLLIRGIGLGCSMMPTMASAYAVVRSDQVPGATSVLNTLQRLGGSIGTALLAVVLAEHARAALGPGAASSGGLIQTLSPAVRAHVAGPLASAFGDTFWWALAATLIALIPASVLAASQRRERQAMDAGAAGGGRLSPSSLRARVSLTRSNASVRAGAGMGNAIRTAIDATKAK
ncbi:MAG TPA: MDR family MFS transporter [Solirubrobacteraceae bacterium]|nr:MDR family MFS transporter [Solirubrobacteraceae bacterium]